MKTILAIAIALMVSACEPMEDQTMTAPEPTAKEQCLKVYREQAMALAYQYATKDIDSITYIHQLDSIKNNLNNCINAN